jgi:hypothetical protein
MGGDDFRLDRRSVIGIGGAGALSLLPLSGASTGTLARPAATIAVARTRRGTVRFADLPRRDHPGRHPWSDRFSLSVSPRRAVLSARGATVNRPLEFTLRLEDASGTEHAFTERYGPADGLEVSFDIGDVTLPTTTGRTAVVHARDPLSNRWTTRLVKRQRHLGIPYRLLDGIDRTRWVSDDSLNRPVGRTRGCVHDVLEGEEEFVVFTAQRFGETTFGASGTFPVEHYDARYEERYRRDRTKRVTPVEYAAEGDDPYLDRYAGELASAIERAGFTEPEEKVLAAARTVQTLPYRWGVNPRGRKTLQFPLQLLRNGYGVCSGRTVLLHYLLGTDAFGNANTAYIACRMRESYHWASGVDVRTFGYEPGEEPDEWYTFAPTRTEVRRGVPDTAYVFVETIGVRELGEFDPSVYSDLRLWDTGDLVLGRG